MTYLFSMFLFDIWDYPWHPSTDSVDSDAADSDASTEYSTDVSNPTASSDSPDSSKISSDSMFESGNENEEKSTIYNSKPNDETEGKGRNSAKQARMKQLVKRASEQISNRRVNIEPPKDSSNIY